MWLMVGTSGGLGEHGNKFSGSKMMQFFDQLRKYKLLKMDSGFS
jgi:hypothetical protein